MKKTITKLIGSVLLMCMVLASACPLTIMAEETTISESNENEKAFSTEQSDQQGEAGAIEVGGQAVSTTSNVIEGVKTGTENLTESPEKKEETAPTSPSETVPLTEGSVQTTKMDADESDAALQSNEDKQAEENKRTALGASASTESAAEEKKNDNTTSLTATEEVGNETSQKEIIDDKSITNNTGMFKAVSAYLMTEGGQEYLVMALSGTGYHELIKGTYEQAIANGDGTAENGNGSWIHGYVNADGKWEFKIPLTAGESYVPIVAVSDDYYTKYLKGKNSLERSFYPRQFTIDREAKKLVTGDYEISLTLTIENNVESFPVKDATLDNVGGPNSNNYKSDLILELGSDSFDKAFVGTAEEAAKAATTIAVKEQTAAIPVKWVKQKGDPTSLVTLLENPFITSWHSVGDGIWYERKLTVSEKDGTLTIDVVTEEDKQDKEEEKDEEKQDEESGEETKPDKQDEEKPDEKKEEEKQDNQDALDGSTAVIDSSTTLPDGVYTPDSFSFSGGSGRAYITCSQVTVTNGQAYAKIAFSSANYGYVKASGGTYYPTIEGGVSTFVIPVQLNQNNTIIGMTTAMSQPHEITYTIFVYIAAAEGKDAADVVNGDTIGEDNKMDETAPTIIGVTGGEEIKLEHAEYLKAFRYENGIVLIEIDRISGTEMESEELPKEDTQSNTDENEETIIDEESGSTQKVKTTADYQMELYQAAVVKYLIVPEGIELPAGLDKKAIIIRLPKNAVYVSSDSLAAEMENLGLLDLIKATGVTEENCKSETLKNLLKEKKVISVGSLTDLNYTELVKAKIDLAIGSTEEILPKQSNADKNVKDYQEQYTKLTERMALLDIPLLLDRAADEKDPKGQQEWLKLLGILFGKEAESNTLIAKGN